MRDGETTHRNFDQTFPVACSKVSSANNEPTLRRCDERALAELQICE